MGQQTINNGETGLVVRTKLNDNFTELYDLADVPQYNITGSAGTYLRVGVRSDKAVRDKTLTPTGFAGTEGVDWYNIDSH